MLALVLPHPAAALEPLAGPGNYAAVCEKLGRVAVRAEAMVEAARVDKDAHARLGDYTDALMSMAFDAGTRATVDADDLDELLTTGEYVALIPEGFSGDSQAEALWNHLDQFARKYRCKITRTE